MTTRCWGAMGECGARTQGAPIAEAMGVTEDAAACRPARPGGPCFVSLGAQRGRPARGGPSEAERAGFEPATHLSARTRFPVALLRPLGHLSVRRDILPDRRRDRSSARVADRCGAGDHRGHRGKDDLPPAGHRRDDRGSPLPTCPGCVVATKYPFSEEGGDVEPSRVEVHEEPWDEAEKGFADSDDARHEADVENDMGREIDGVHGQEYLAMSRCDQVAEEEVRPEERDQVEEGSADDE